MAKNLHLCRREQGAFHPMTPYFRSYAANLTRIRLAELIDHHATRLRHGRARPSLIVNPLTGRPYLDKASDAKDLSTLRSSDR
jgi:hypothetical protein